MTEAAPSTKAPDDPPPWTGELIAGLDWKRIAELARALSSSYGFKLGKTRVHPDGLSDFVITRGDAPATQGTLVRLARWNQWMASRECLAQLVEQMKLSGIPHGIFIAPGGFAPSARDLAQQSGIEMVDADTLALRLNGLPAQHRDFYFNLATAGNATTPGCPVCLHPLTLASDSNAGTGRAANFPELSYSSSDIVGGTVRARRIEILPHCEVQFLGEVRTAELTVHGRVTGDFVCEGSVVLHPGATLSGSVAARSVIVRPGAEMLGETRILNGKPEPFGKAAPARVWRCENPHPQPGCEAVSFLQH